MSLLYFEGPAGSGKTYRLMEELRDMLTAEPLKEHERVLALTFMHGSRRRMQVRLAQAKVLKGRFHARTVDSFARSVALRWRTLVAAIDSNLVVHEGSDFDSVCNIAYRLLQEAVVADWVRSLYPVVLVDELQDCAGNRLGIFNALESAVHILAAADGFQDLRSTGPNEAVSWLHGSSGRGVELSGNRRTEQKKLLDAATALRMGGDCGPALGKQVIGTPKGNVAAACAARQLHWHPKGDWALLTPTRPAKSKFVREVVERLTSGPFENLSHTKGTVGPFAVHWELSPEDESQALMDCFGDESGDVSLAEIHRLANTSAVGLGEIWNWAEKRFRLAGQATFTRKELTTAVGRTLQFRRAFVPSSTARVSAMTIHQAKNREFYGVIVLWPFAVTGDMESVRRLLYNAITRAKEQAIVLVQEDPRKGRRTEMPPFSAAKGAT